MLAVLGVMGLCLDLLLHFKEVVLGKKRELLHWSGVVQWDAAGRTLCLHPTAFSLWHKPAARAGGFFLSCNGSDKKQKKMPR